MKTGCLESKVTQQYPGRPLQRLLPHSFPKQDILFLSIAASAPTNVSAVILSATVVQLTWEPPTSPHGILHDYRIRYKLASNASYGASINIGKKLTVTVGELMGYSDYEFQVRFLMFQRCFLVSFTPNLYQTFHKKGKIFLLRLLPFC